MAKVDVLSPLACHDLSALKHMMACLWPWDVLIQNLEVEDVPNPSWVGAVIRGRLLQVMSSAFIFKPG